MNAATASPLQVPPPSDFVEFPLAAVEQSAAERFAQQVRLYPDRPVVRASDGAMSYRQLDAAANRVAHALLAHSPWRPLAECEADELATWEAQAEPVPVLIGQGAQAVAAALGVLKAGKVYLPLDPADPHARLRFILQDLPARLILATDETAALARTLAPPECTIIALDQIAPHVANTDPALTLSPRAPAYLVYTSGSTGQPKGVIHSQRSLLHDVREKTHLMRLSPSDRLSLLGWGTGHALKIVFSALLNGAALHLFDLKREGLAPLAAWLSCERITVHTAAAPIHRSFLELLPAEEKFPKIRVVRTGSDTMHPEDLARYRRHLDSHCCTINALSSNETGTICAEVMNGATPLGGKTVPIGRPVEGVEVLLLDETGEEVGIGEPGRIALRGRYLARGYWRRPGLTRAVFHRDPRDPELITFHSGDVGLRRADGRLEHFGRSDSQVKIRGLRVDTPEVEAALLEHENIQAAVVQAVENERGEKRLAAYVVARTRPAPTVTALRQFLEPRFAAHMIPAAFVRLDAIPLLPSGKTNRRALPPPGRARPELGHAFTAPRSAIEEKLAEIWSHVLGLDCVGVHDHFMDLGGDSLRAGQVVARAIDAFGVDLPLRALFESPTVAQMAAVVAEQRTRGTREKIERRDGTGPWELSFGQERLWFLQQLDPTSPAYNMPKLIRLTGTLDHTALRGALDAIVARHEILRTRYPAFGGQPLAVVQSARKVELPDHDLSALRGDERAAALQRAIHAEIARPFDLAREPVLRCALFRLGGGEHALLVLTHHIASDGWSRGLLLRELAVHYEAQVTGGAAPLPPLPIQYADFAHWQRVQQRTPAIAAQLDYWSQRLRDLPPALELPLDRPRPAKPSTHGAAHHFTYPKAAAIEALARREGVTLFMLLLAAFQTLLHRYTGQEDLVIGCPVAGRSVVETEELIGFFVNMLVLRTDVRGQPTFRELLDRVREVALGAYAHPDVPFEKLVEHLQPTRDLNRNPLFQIAFSVHTPRYTHLDAAGVNFQWMETERGTTALDQGWIIESTGTGLRIRVEYHTDLFDAATIARMGAHFSVLLDGILAEPDASIGRLPLMGEDERRQVRDWGRARGEYPTACIHTLFERHAARTPEAVALTFEGENLTYRALNARADALAERLTECGVGPEALMAICFERSLELVIAILGILKAGGAYVPIDPASPRDRIAFILADARAAVLVTQRSLLDALPGTDAPVVCMEEIDREPRTARLPAEVSPANLAYAIYTSGSTGQPKGALNTHANVTRLFSAAATWFSSDERDVWTLFHSSAFDFSVWEIWGALLHGARLVIVQQPVTRAPEVFRALLRREGVTVLSQTPSAFRQLIEVDRAEGTPLALRWIFLGGEALDPRSLKPWFERHGDECPRLVNLYGLTETAVHSCYRLLRAADTDRPGVIGGPLPDTEIHLLDALQQPVPIGVAGEIYIGGASLGRGYLHRPALTAERFVPHPADPRPGARLYRTGDAARWRADGDLEFFGRLDQQVKIRGFRVELGEIESVLAQHPAVRAPTVLLREDVPGDQRLVAYLVAPAIPPDLRAFLASKLPDYMIPSAFVTLEKMPLTVNGKLDRKALPAPERPLVGSGFVPPRNAIEEAVAGIWSELLRVPRVGADDHFFDLGGHSLLATQVVSRVRELLRLYVPLRTLFEAPTLSAFSTALPAFESSPGQTEKIAQLLREIRALAPENVREQLHGAE